MIQLFDLSQLVSEPTRITETSATIIDHVYTNRPENVTESFISHFCISDHFPVCFTRKVNCKITKNEHVTKHIGVLSNLMNLLSLAISKTNSIPLLQTRQILMMIFQPGLNLS